MIDARSHLWSADVLPELRLGLENLRAHKLRSLLTMLGMIFGVAAVVAMLSIGAGAQQEVMAFIEQLGVRNLIVEAREAADGQALQKVRKLSPGLTFSDLRVIQSNLDGISAATARKRFTPSKLMPKPFTSETPVVYGVSPAYKTIGNLAVASGRFFDDSETTAAAPVAVLGEAAAANLFGADDAVGRYVKVNDQWFRVIGVAGPQLTVQSDVAGIPAQDRNNIIYVPLFSSVFRLEDGQSAQKDEIDGIYLQMNQGSDIPGAAAMIRGILDRAHRSAGDFTIVSPAELLAEQRRTQRIFEMVMASVLERTREIGVRRAIGARQRDVVRQFLIETTIISLTGGVAGILLGVGLSQLIGVLAGWSTIVTTGSIVLAFGVSVAIGIVFGLYPAVRASRLDPVKALHYE
jgi:putative ABC transport system permease protein